MADATSTRVRRTPGPAPYGWRRRDGALEPDPATQSAVQLIVELARAGWNDTKITAFLNLYRVPPPRAEYWGVSMVRNVRVNAGLVRAEATLATVERRRA